MRSPSVALVAVLLVTGIARAAPAAHESPFSASIEYVVPASCPSAEAFEAIVIGRLGFDPFAEDAPDHVLVSIEQKQQTLEGRLEWRDAAGRWAGDRTFPAHTTDCAELVRAMGFALAVQINLLAAGQREDALAAGSPERADTESDLPNAGARRTPESGASETTAAAGDRASSSASSSGPSTPWVFGFGAGGALGVGMSPDVIALGRFFALAGWDAWSLELGGELSNHTVERRADGAGYSQQVWLVSAAVCGTKAPFSLCVLAKTGRLNASGRTIDVPASSSGTTLQAGLRFALHERLGNHVFVAPRIEGLVNLMRPSVTLDAIPVWTTPPVAGTLGLDVGADF